MRKLLASALLCSASLSVTAGPFSDYAFSSRLADAAFESPEGIDDQAIEQLLSKKPDSWKSFFQAWSFHERQGQGPVAWGNVGMKMLKVAGGDDIYQTSAIGVIPGSGEMVFQQDALINPAQVHAYQVKFNTIEVSGYHVYDTARPIFGLTVSSAERMKMGIAPVGPDNSEIKVCSLGRSSAAPYLEVTSSQKESISSLTGLDMERCLFGQKETMYWQYRAADLGIKPYSGSIGRHLVVAGR